MRSNLGMNRICIRVFHFCVAEEGTGCVASHRRALNILQQVIERLLLAGLIGIVSDILRIFLLRSLSGNIGCAEMSFAVLYNELICATYRFLASVHLSTHFAVRNAAITAAAARMAKSVATKLFNLSLRC